MVAWKGTQKTMKQRSATPRLRMKRLVVLFTCPFLSSTARTRELPTVPIRKIKEYTKGMITEISCQVLLSLTPEEFSRVSDRFILEAKCPLVEKKWSQDAFPLWIYQKCPNHLQLQIAFSQNFLGGGNNNFLLSRSFLHLLLHL